MEVRLPRRAHAPVDLGAAATPPSAARAAPACGTLRAVGLAFAAFLAGVSAPAAGVVGAAGTPPPDHSLTAAATGGAGDAYTALPPTRILDTRQTGQPLGAGASLDLTVVGGSVPATATAVALNVTVTGTTAGSYLTAYPAGESVPAVSNLNWPPGDTLPAMVIVPVGAAGQVAFRNAQGETQLIVDLEGYFAPGSPDGPGSYVPLSPARLCDTRPGAGYACSGGPVGPGGTLNVQVTGAGGVPASGVSAVLLNVTATGATAASFLTVYPQGSARPTASNLNVAAGQTIANRVLVPVGPSGGVSVFNAAGDTEVIVDVSGYFSEGGAAPSLASLFTPVTPVRLLDTRGTGRTLGPGGVATVTVSGEGGIAADADALVANVTSVDGTAGSYLTVYPGGARPASSDLNWRPGQIASNLTVAALSGAGALSVFNAAGRADVLIDAFGYFVAASPAPAPSRPAAPFDTGNPAADDTSLGSAMLDACWNGYTASWTGTSAACEAASAQALDAAMQGEGLTPVSITSSFWALPYDQQLLFLANADRTARNLPAAAGPDSQLDGYALTGARNDADPRDPNNVSWGSNWAWVPNTVAAEFEWVYNDGLGSGNVDCTAGNTSGCWGHRENILREWSGPVDFGGACVTAAQNARSCAEIFVQQ